MQWRVTKTGLAMFDALHAYGLGIVLANALECDMELIDEGIAYGLNPNGSTFQ